MTGEDMRTRSSTKKPAAADTRDMDDGKSLREHCPRQKLGTWPAQARRDVVATLEHSSRGRLPELIPIRHGRMLQSPFAFFRGSAGLMARDLSGLGTPGLQVQACGDCHLMNFGLFATPERKLVFDLNDFDETHPAPWEWDVKRLVASIVLAGRDFGVSDRAARDAAEICARAYRQRMRELSRMAPLAVWYDVVDWQTVIDSAKDRESRRFRERIAEQARKRVVEHLFPKIVDVHSGTPRFVDQPPLLFHPAEHDFEARVHAGLQSYRDTLSHDRGVLLDRYRLVDCAMKVVGIGSVGARCYIALLISDQGDPLILQFKEVGRSVLEFHTAPSAFEHQGQRVVVGQRLMQSASDIFLGWVRGRHGNDFYVRQLRDMKMSVPLHDLDSGQLQRYARLCGYTLARAHARSGNAVAIAGYLGKGNVADKALGAFALAYADQAERDHAALRSAVRKGRIDALTDT